MNVPVLRLLPFVTAAGPWQMAADEVLLEAAAAGVASFRLYGWSVATLSLGYFQPAAVRQTDPLLAALPYVRRASGGAALVHDREVTYALALPNGAPWQRSLCSPATGGKDACGWPWRMHEILRVVFSSFGIETRLCATEQKLGAVLCFQHHTPADLLLGDAKIAGSAQRKMRGAVLQHGGILLARSKHTPALPGVAELIDSAISPVEFSARVTEQLASQTGWRLENSDWSIEDRRRIDELAATKYGSTAWNDKR